MSAQDALLNLLEEKKPQLTRTTFDAPPPGFDGADPWLLTSLLQKAIRRGELLVARRAGHQLLALDSTRLWRRLLIVALEDIGIGAVEDAALLITLAGLPAARSALGSNAGALDVALQLACEARKDRSADALSSIARELESDHSLNAAPEITKYAILSASYMSWQRRLRAAIALGGIAAPAAERLARYQPVKDIFRTLGVPPVLLAACELFHGKLQTLFPYFVPLSYLLWLQDGAPQAVLSHSLSARLIGEIPDYGFDPLHTRLGRRALELWLKSYLNPAPFGVGQVAAALWNREAGASARTLVWPTGQAIAEEGALQDLLRRHLAPSRHGAIGHWIAQEAEGLFLARQAVWRSAQVLGPNSAIPLEIHHDG